MKKIILTAAIILTSGLLISSGIILTHKTESKPSNISKVIYSQNHQEVSYAD